MADKGVRRFGKLRCARALSGSEARSGGQNMQVWKEGRGKHLLQACETLPRSEAKDDRCGSVTVAPSCPYLRGRQRYGTMENSCTSSCSGLFSSVVIPGNSSIPKSGGYWVS